MAAISSNGTGGGNYSAGPSWAGGVAPTSLDDVTVTIGDTITLDTTGLACKSFVSDSGSTINCNTGANWDLTSETGITINGSYSMDMSASYTYAGVLYLNNSRTTGASTALLLDTTSSGTLKGFTKQRWTTLNGAIIAGATSAPLTDATGYQVGDILVFGTTSDYTGTHKVDVVTLTSVVANVVGWVGGITYDHADGGPVGNMSSNVTVRPVTLGDASGIHSRGTPTIQNIQLYGIHNSAFPIYGLCIQDTDTTSVYEDCAFYEYTDRPHFLRSMSHTPSASGHVFYSSTLKEALYCNYTTAGAEFDDILILSGSSGFYPQNNSGYTLTNSTICGCTQGVYGGNAHAIKATGCKIFANQYGCRADSAVIDLTDCDIGGVAKNGYSFYLSSVSEITAKDCTLGYVTSKVVNSSSVVDGSFVRIVNEDNDATKQYTYTNLTAATPTIEWDATGGYGSTPCWKINTQATARTIELPWSSIIAVDDTVTLVTGRVKRDNAQPVTVTLSGLGLTADTYTCTGANDTWEQFDVQITNNTGNNGTLTLTVEVTSGNAGTVCLSDFTAPPAAAVNTGNMSYVQDGLPVGAIISNFVSAADVMNALTVTGTVVGSYGKMFVDQDTTISTINTLAEELHRMRGLDESNPWSITKAGSTTTEIAGDIEIEITGDGETSSTITRQP